MDARAMLLTADINLDQHIDLQEFIRLMEFMEFEVSLAEAKEMFRLIDGNASDKISL